MTKPYAGMEERLKEQLRVGVAPFVGKLFRTESGRLLLLMKVELELRYSLERFSMPRFNFTHLNENGEVVFVYAIAYDGVESVISDLRVNFSRLKHRESDNDQ
jgi:hypothetical protein